VAICSVGVSELDFISVALSTAAPRRRVCYGGRKLMNRTQINPLARFAFQPSTAVQALMDGRFCAWNQSFHVDSTKKLI
jgi:hypothetical protein